MAEIINFIPTTVGECRSLLLTLRDNPEGVSLTDRYGNRASLTPDECSRLAKLTETHIGEKTPKKTATKARTNNLKNNSNKTASKK